MNTIKPMFFALLLMFLLSASAIADAAANPKAAPNTTIRPGESITISCGEGPGDPNGGLTKACSCWGDQLNQIWMNSSGQIVREIALGRFNECTKQIGTHSACQ